jgi:hypothetical protein
VAPSLQFFTKNSHPSRGNSANEVTQAPLLIIENHLSHNFTPKLWGVANLWYQQGGHTTADGATSNMVRIGAVLIYVNLKKLKAKTTPLLSVQ